MMRMPARLMAMVLCGLAVSAMSAEPDNRHAAAAGRLPAPPAPAVHPEGRAPLANPYDQVLSIQRAQEEASRKHAIAIREMSMKASRTVEDPEAVMRTQITRLLQQPRNLDPKAALDLLNLDSGPIEVERIPAGEEVRDWMVPSISMLEQGDTSIGVPENTFLSDWELIRNARGETIVGRIGDPLSRIRVRVGMVLGEYGRIMAVRDTPDAHYLILESGDRIRGKPRNGGAG